MLNLKVNEILIKSNFSDWSLRFVDGDQTAPVLYYLGKRVTKGWKIELEYDSFPEKESNANTADV